MRSIKTVVCAVLAALLVVGCTMPLDQLKTNEPAVAGQELTQSLTRAPGDPKPGFTANVMAPLHVKVYNDKNTLEAKDWSDFEYELQTAKSMGIDAVSVDVWWGDVEGTADQSFTWSYYDTLFQKIRDAGLKIVPIMSFHQCGTNVSDDYYSAIPTWIWGKYQSSGISADDLKYQSETSAFCAEVVSLWADAYVASQYQQFMDEFENHFASYASSFQEINISCGTAGELRYPSYNSHDWGDYPNRGTLQCYGRLAREDFRNDMLAKYGSLAGINIAWGTNLTSVNQINPPSDPNAFFGNKDYLNIRYGKDLVDWYNQSLKEHGKTMIQAAKAAFNNQLAAVPFGIKIPGVHWMMGSPSMPRAAEVTAGLIQTSVNYQSSTSGYGYRNLIDTCKNNNREVFLHFTCLEMNNENWDPQYSQAQALVFWVAAEAAYQNVKIKGENALPGGVTSDSGWNNIENAFDWASYAGFTALRINLVTRNSTGKGRYTSFIAKYAQSTNKVIVHYKEFQSATSYTIHCWDGLTGDYEMQYEGYFNNAHWWKVTINNAPASFKFCFKNSNNTWDGYNRQYSKQAAEIYATPWNTSVYTSRP